MSEPRIVLFDLETLPNLREAMKIWPGMSNYPGLTLKASINTLICFGWQTLGEGPAKCLSAWDLPGWQTNINDDRELCEQAYVTLKDADAVVTHNGKRFDWRFLQTRLLLHGLPRLPDIPHVDTKAIASSKLYLFSNKLDNIAGNLRLERKLDHEGWDLWVKVSERNPEACALMAKYCTQDVNVLAQIFEKLRPFAQNLPNQNLFSVGGQGRNVCPSCGSTRLKSGGIRATKTMTYRRYCCQDCGSWSRTDVKDKLPRSV